MNSFLNTVTITSTFFMRSVEKEPQGHWNGGSKNQIVARVLRSETTTIIAQNENTNESLSLIFNNIEETKQ